MPVYDCRLNEAAKAFDLPGAPCPMPAEPFPRFDGKPGVLRDATGAVIEWVVRCNTETGVVERYDRRDGQFHIDPTTKRAVVLRENRPAPLTYTPRDEKKDEYEWALIPPSNVPDVPGFVEYPATPGLSDAERDGAARLRRLWFRKHGVGEGAPMRYPPFGTEDVKNNDDIIAETNALLDEQILAGAQIPKDVVQHSESGSGYNGRLLDEMAQGPPDASGCRWRVACINGFWVRYTGVSVANGTVTLTGVEPTTPPDEPDQPLIVERKP